MAGPSPLNSACNCCEVPPSDPPYLAFVSASKSKTCLLGRCGFGPEGYLVETINKADGSTETTTCTITESGCGPCTTVCAGTIEETFTQSGSVSTSSTSPTWDTEISGSGTVTTTTTTTYNSDCSTSSESTCSGTSTRTETLTKSPSSTFPNQPDKIVEQCDATASWEDGACRWTGTTTRTITIGDEEYLDSEVGVIGPCVELPLTESTVSPEPREAFTEYSDPSEEVITCNEEVGTTTLPDFLECTPEGEEPVTPDLEEGQGYNNGAFDFEDEETGSTSSQVFQYRIEHVPIATCYLKVWIKKTIETESETTETIEPPYEWRGSGYPCYEDELKPYTACENTIYGDASETITADTGSSISVSIQKYSFLENYEPNDPDENGDQGCKPNGFPVANISTCEND
jgi:hypothetical protein